MNRMSFCNKQNTSSSFYAKTSTDYYPISYKQKQFTSNLHLIDNMIIESQTIVQKLKQKISLDQIKIQQNYISLQELSQQMQQSCIQIQNNKQIQNIIRLKKQSYKNCMLANQNKVKSIFSRTIQSTKQLQQSIQMKQKEIQQQKQDRQVMYSKLIDEFEHEMFAIQKQLKIMKKQEEQSCDKIQLIFYTLQQKGKDMMQKQKYIRKSQHETIIKLIGQCIQNFRYVY